MKFIKSHALLLLIILLASVLRLVQLGNNPPSLYWDEVSLGWNASSILKTGNDEFGRHLPLDTFPAFGDYKPPVYVYAVASAMKIFGQTDVAVRLPSALAGIITVLLTYLIVLRLFDNKNIALLSSLFVAISPWHIQVSRAAFEANLALMFMMLGLWLFLESLDRYRFLIAPALLSFLVSAYTFNSNRIVAPLLLIILIVVFLKKISIKYLFVAILIAAALSVPLLKHVNTPEGRLRFNEVSIFNNTETFTKSVDRATYDNVWWGNIVHNRRIDFSLDFLYHYFSHFEGRFLFISGDVNPRLSIQDVGEMYLIELPLLIAGLYFLVKNREKRYWIVFALLIIAPIPAGVSLQTPHALRALTMVIPLEIIAAYGLWNLWLMIKKSHPKFKLGFILLGILAYLLNFTMYIENYWVHYPKEFSTEWQDGYKELVNYVVANQNKYDLIRVTEAYGRPYVYFTFYSNYDPAKFYTSVSRYRDDQGFYHVSGFDKYRFGTFSKLEKGESKKILDVYYGQEYDLEKTPIKEIKSLSGQTIFKLSDNLSD